MSEVENNTFLNKNNIEEEPLMSKNLNINDNKNTGDNFTNLSNNKNKFKTLGKILTIIIVIFCIFAIISVVVIARRLTDTTNKISVNEQKECNSLLDFSCLINNFNNLNNSNEIKIKGKEEGRTNILLIGRDSIAGLTDTIILVSVYHNEKKIATLNFPRDLYVQASYKNDNDGTEYITEKINALYPYAERASEKEGNGARALVDFLSKEYNIPIHYWAVTNFEGVEKIVDELGGIQVIVDKAFTDCEFPRQNYNGFIRPCPSFKVGEQTMDGKTALIFARSRMSPDDGGDFARSKRQMKVINSILDKIKQKSLFENINSVQNYLNILGETFRTNASIGEINNFYKLTKEWELKNSFITNVWDTQNGFLCVGPQDRGYIIVYCDKANIGSNYLSNYKKRAQNFIKNLLFEGESLVLFESKVIILGNLSNETEKVRLNLVNLGFKNIVVNNNYQNTSKATAKSIEKSNIYIKKENLYNLFKNLSNEIKFEYNLEKELPQSKTIHKNYDESDIIILVESIT